MGPNVNGMSNKYRKTFNNHSLSRSRSINVGRLKQSRQYFLKKRFLRIRLFLLITAIILILLSIFYYLFLSGFSYIKNVEINKIKDNHLITEQELKQTVELIADKKRFFISQNNIVFFKKKSLEEMLKEDSRVETFSVEKKWPDTLLIEITESEPIALLISFANNENCYLNSEGRVIYVSSFTTLLEQKLPVFYDQTEVNLADPSYIKLFKNVLSLIKCDILSQNDIKADMVKISEKADIFEVEITTNEQWRILINSEADFEQQIGNLALILKEKIKDRNNLEQIDLRFGERIFYKSKE